MECRRLVPDVRRVEAAQLLLGQVRKVEVARRHEVAREDADLKCNKLGLNEIQFALKFDFGAITFPLHLPVHHPSSPEIL